MLKSEQIQSFRQKTRILDSHYVVELACKDKIYIDVITNIDPDTFEEYARLYEHQIRESNFEGFFRKIRGEGFMVEPILVYDFNVSCKYCGNCNQLRG